MKRHYVLFTNKPGGPGQEAIFVEVQDEYGNSVYIPWKTDPKDGYAMLTFPPQRTRKEARQDKENEDVAGHIRHNEWFLINHGLNLARLKLFGYFVNSDGESEAVSHDAIDETYDWFVKEIESRGREIMIAKDSLLPERLTESSEEFTTTP